VIPGYKMNSADPRAKPKDLKELCLTCGLCCCVLEAKCTKEEAIHVTTATSTPINNFVSPDALHKSGTHPGLLLSMLFPCTYLRGRPLKAVRCAAYRVKDKDGVEMDPRPNVCKVYLCRIAIEYKLNMITLSDAKSQLSRAYYQGDVTIFNWVHTDIKLIENQEVRSAVDLLIRSDDELNSRFKLQNTCSDLRSKGFSETYIDFIVAQKGTELVIPRSEEEHSLFSMYFNVFKKRGIVLDIFSDPVDYQNWNPEFLKGFKEGCRATMSVLADLVTTRSELEKELNELRNKNKLKGD